MTLGILRCLQQLLLLVLRAAYGEVVVHLPSFMARLQFGAGDDGNKVLVSFKVVNVVEQLVQRLFGFSDRIVQDDSSYPSNACE